eukprot:m.1555543 g.1555543  ORF g.1555543 m.1555543 type:complete len:178 (+) comp25270_c1_seq98:2264-2797(+)
MHSLFNHPVGCRDTVIAPTADAYIDWYVNASHRSTFFEISLTKSPWSPEGYDWLVQARTSLRSLERQIPGVTYYLSGQAAFDFDLMNFVYEGMHRMTAFVLVLVFVFVGIAYGSAVLALKAVFTIAGTLSIVFGLTTIVYVSCGTMNVAYSCCNGIRCTTFGVFGVRYSARWCPRKR